MPKISSTTSSSAILMPPLNSVCRMPDITSASRGELIFASMALAAVACCKGALIASMKMAQSMVPVNTNTA